MRKLLWILGYFAAGMLALCAVAAVVIRWRSGAVLQTSYVIAVRPVSIPGETAVLARGKYIAETRGCIDCQGRDFAVAKVIRDGATGTLYGPNLTRGCGGRAGAFKDEDWVRAIRHGVGPENHGLFIMPADEYSHFSDSDLGALIAYLKTVPPVDRERVPTSLGPVSRVLLTIGKIKRAAEVIDHPQLAARRGCAERDSRVRTLCREWLHRLPGNQFFGRENRSWPAELAARDKSHAPCGRAPFKMERRRFHQDNLHGRAARRDGAEPCDAAHVWADG